MPSLAARTSLLNASVLIGGVWMFWQHRRSRGSPSARRTVAPLRR